MKQSRATIRYAKALLELSKEQNSVESSYSDMLFINRICIENKDFCSLLKTPIVKTDLKIKILNEIFLNSISSLSLSFLVLMTNKKRESLLLDISSAFIKLYKNENNIKEVTVTTAIPLDEQMKKELYSFVKKHHQSKIELIEKVDKKIIGGTIVRMDDKQLDASISTKLKSLKQTFSKNLYIQDY